MAAPTPNCELKNQCMCAVSLSRSHFLSLSRSHLFTYLQISIGRILQGEGQPNVPCLNNPKISGTDPVIQTNLTLIYLTPLGKLRPQEGMRIHTSEWDQEWLGGELKAPCLPTASTLRARVFYLRTGVSNSACPEERRSGALNGGEWRCSWVGAQPMKGLQKYEVSSSHPSSIFSLPWPRSFSVSFHYTWQWICMKDYVRNWISSEATLGFRNNTRYHLLNTYHVLVTVPIHHLI